MRPHLQPLVPFALIVLLGGAWGLLGGKVPGDGMVPRLQAAEPTSTPVRATPPRNKDDIELEQMMKGRKAIRAFTVRGQSIAEAPPFKVETRQDKMQFYPCTNCHDNQFVDRRVRKLTEEHRELVFEHGGGRFWCYDVCHNGRDMNRLISYRRQPISYDESYKLCGQCHFERQKDWVFGGHGKRLGAFAVPRNIPEKYEELKVADRQAIGTWQGERVVHMCASCHNPHSPAIKPYTPSPPPRVRLGLAPPATRGAPAPKPWQKPGPSKGGAPAAITPVSKAPAAGAPAGVKP